MGLRFSSFLYLMLSTFQQSFNVTLKINLASLVDEHEYNVWVYVCVCVLVWDGRWALLCLRL